MLYLMLLELYWLNIFLYCLLEDLLKFLGKKYVFFFLRKDCVQGFKQYFFVDFEYIQFFRLFLFSGIFKDNDKEFFSLGLFLIIFVFVLKVLFVIKINFLVFIDFVIILIIFEMMCDLRNNRIIFVYGFFFRLLRIIEYLFF